MSLVSEPLKSPIPAAGIPIDARRARSRATSQRRIAHRALPRLAGERVVLAEVARLPVERVDGVFQLGGADGWYPPYRSEWPASALDDYSASVLSKASTSFCRSGSLKFWKSFS